MKLLSFGDEEEIAGVTISTRMKSSENTKRRKELPSTKKTDVEDSQEMISELKYTDESEEMILQKAKNKASQYNFDDNEDDSDEEDGVDGLVKGSDAAEKKKMLKEKGEANCFSILTVTSMCHNCHIHDVEQRMPCPKML